MNGTLLATIFMPLVAFALGYALNAFRARESVSALEKTHSDTADDAQLELFVERVVRKHMAKTQEDVDAQVKKLREQVEWDLGEWYEKFSTLHARSAKRAQRDAKPNGAAGPALPAEAPMSVLHFRKPWSP